MESLNSMFKVYKIHENSGTLCQLGHSRDIGLNAGTIPAILGHLATMSLISGPSLLLELIC